MIDSSGPAFPELQSTAINADTLKISGGMSLRDWLAGMALQGYIACWPADGYKVLQQADEVAKTAYKLADAMLEARK